MSKSDNSVAVVVDREATGYPSVPPYHPDTSYPEYPFKGISQTRNWAYELVRRLLRDLGLDESRFGSERWNPLGNYVSPGDTVVLKPNFVSHRNWGSDIGLTDTDGLITHGSVVRAIADYVYIALQGKGSILLGDCPIQATDWTQVSELAGLEQLQQFYRDEGLAFSSRDFRLIVAHLNDAGLIRERQNQNRIQDYIEIDLQEDSLLMPIISDNLLFAVSGYGFGRMRHSHSGKTNLYLFPRELLTANCVINIPKLKSHQKAGLTCALKNLVGINGHKDYLPHFRMGRDEYPPGLGSMYAIYWGLQHLEWNHSNAVIRKLLRQMGRVVRQFFPTRWILLGQGAWYGNDTLWRTILDINRAFFYFDVNDGILANTVRRKCMTIVDGITGGEGESPLSPSSVTSSCILGGGNPAAIDLVASTVMGLDPNAIPQIVHAFDTMKYAITSFRSGEVVVNFNGKSMAFPTFASQWNGVDFAPSAGWVGHVERSGASRSVTLAGARATALSQVNAEDGTQGGLE